MDHFIKKERYNNQQKLRKLSENSPKQYWKFINKLKPNQKESIQPSIEEFYNHFQNINQSNLKDDRYAEQLNVHSNDFLDLPITENEINKCITNLKSGKASCPFDEILNEHIKATRSTLINVYCILFNSVLNTGHVPPSWLEGVIIPIYKNKGPRDDVTNYRPITILSCLGKLFTAVLNNRLSFFLDEHNVLNENQAGFRKSYSCSDHIFTLHALIEIMKKQKKKLFCAFIDFSQAFDTVWRAGLWHKLLESGINGNFLGVIKNMYKNIKSCISAKGQFSNFIESNIGVRQGENLSPILFSMFLNDVQSYLTSNGSVGIELGHPAETWLKLLVLLYADDTIIIADSQHDLQQSLNVFSKYCLDWHLKVNVGKTKIIVFGSRQTRNFAFNIGESNIEIVNQYHYLGVTFSNNGLFYKARKHIYDQSNKALHLLYTRINNADLPVDLMLKLFDHTIVPMLLYGTEIFGFEDIKILEKIHCSFLRRITKAKKSTPLNFLYGELGRYPISVIVETRMLNFWTRLVSGKQSKLSHRIYTFMINEHQNYNFKWLNKIKSILQSVGRPDIWENQFNTDLKYIHKQVKQTLIDQFKQKWHSELSRSNKGKIYLNIKENHGLEMYFNILGKKDMLNIFRYRTANHSLPVETGRYDAIPFDDRLCPLCEIGTIGTEKHYLLECPYFSSERDKYLNTHNNRTQHNISLISTPDAKLLKSVSRFTYHIMNTFAAMPR